MKHAIDPTVDCVFKALLGSEANQNLLIHFLNAVLQSCTQAPVSSVEIINPYNEKEFLNDKLSIVDVKARDQSDRLYQVEIQLCGHTSLPERIFYTWADLYSKQLQNGEDYARLQPTYSIWLLGSPLIREDPDYLHWFQLQDRQGRQFVHPGGIFLLELSKCKIDTVHSELERWLRLFKEGKQLDDQQLPEWMQTQEMRQAMTTLKRFSEKEKAYHFYQARQEYLRRERAIQRGIEETRVQLERARQERAESMQREQEAMQKEREATKRAQEAMQKEQEARQREQEAKQREQASATENEAAVAEIERLKALLAEQGKS